MELLYQCCPVEKLLQAALKHIDNDEALKEAVAQFQSVTVPAAWHVADVKALDETLTDEQCKDVLNQFTHKYDCGHDWEVLECLREGISGQSVE